MRYTVEERVYPGGLTCSGHPLACASAEREEGMIEHARRLGTEVIGPALAELADKHPSVGEVRGLVGVLGARAGPRPDDPGAAGALQRHRGGAAPMTEFAAACKRAGLWPFTHFNPPTSYRRARRASRRSGTGSRSWTRRWRWRTDTPPRDRTGLTTQT